MIDENLLFHSHTLRLSLRIEYMSFTCKAGFDTCSIISCSSPWSEWAREGALVAFSLVQARVIVNFGKAESILLEKSRSLSFSLN